MACPGQIQPPLTPGNRDKAQNWAGSPSTPCSPKMKLLLLATRGKGEVWKQSHPALGTGGGSPTACGVLDRRLSSGWARVLGGIPPLASSLPTPVPSGPATCSFLRPCNAGCTGEPSRPDPTSLREPRCRFLDLQPSLSAGAVACLPLIILEDLGVRPRMAVPYGPRRPAPEFSPWCSCLGTVSAPARCRRPRPAEWPHLSYLVPGFSPMVRAPAARPVRGELTAF